jgi:hypothetical protein
LASQAKTRLSVEHRPDADATEVVSAHWAAAAAEQGLGRHLDDATLGLKVNKGYQQVRGRVCSD